MDFLKALFEAGALDFEQFVAAVTAAGIKLVNLADGKYVDKEKLETKIEEIKGLKEQLTEANTAIEGFKNLDVDGIKKQADEWKEKYESAQKDAQRVAYEAQVKAIVEKETFTSISAKKAFLADLLGKNFQLEGENLLGYADFKKAYAEADPTAFDTEDPTKPRPKGAPPLGKGEPVKMTKEDFRKLNYTEKLKLKEDHPELYETLRK